MTTIEPLEGLPPYSDSQLIARLQTFSKGGFEGVVYYRARDSYRPRGLGVVGPRFFSADVRLKKGEDNAKRAKQTVRRKARELGVDRLATFTTREASNDPVELLGRIARFVKEYNRVMRATGKGALAYVAVPEPHPSNPWHWHVHMALSGYLNIRVANAVWWRLCGGRGMGNIDIRKMRAPNEGVRTVRIARYISKYITKNFDAGLQLDGRRRFRASITELQPKRAFVLASTGLTGALNELLDLLRLARSDLVVYYFRDGSGFGFSCNGDIGEESPPPF